MGNVFPRKRGFESFGGKCLKQIRVSDNVSFIHIHPSMSTYTIEMLHGKICIRDNLYTGEIQEQYIAEKGEKANFLCPAKGKFSREEGFLGGQCISKKKGLGELLGQVS